MAWYELCSYITISIDLNHNLASSSSEVTPLHWQFNKVSFVHAHNLIIYVQYCRCQSVSANLIMLTDYWDMGSCYKYCMGWWNSYVYCVLISQYWEKAFLIMMSPNRETTTKKSFYEMYHRSYKTKQCVATCLTIVALSLWVSQKMDATLISIW